MVIKRSAVQFTEVKGVDGTINFQARLQFGFQKGMTKLEIKRFQNPEYPSGIEQARIFANNYLWEALRENLRNIKTED